MRLTFSTQHYYNDKNSSFNFTLWMIFSDPIICIFVRVGNGIFGNEKVDWSRGECGNQHIFLILAFGSIILSECCIGVVTIANGLPFQGSLRASFPKIPL